MLTSVQLARVLLTVWGVIWIAQGLHEMLFGIASIFFLISPAW